MTNISKIEAVRPALDEKVERKWIIEAGNNISARLNEVRERATTYATYAAATGNSDLVRLLRSKLPEDLAKRLDAWIKHHIPFKPSRKVVKDPATGKAMLDANGKRISRVSYKKDKKVEALHGAKTIFNSDTFQMPFDAYKAPKVAREYTDQQLNEQFVKLLARALRVATEHATETDDYQHANAGIYANVVDTLGNYLTEVASALNVTLEANEDDDDTDDTGDGIAPVDLEKEAEKRHHLGNMAKAS